MTLGETLCSSLADARTASGRQTVTRTDTAAGWSAGATVEQADALSCQFADIVCQRLGEPLATKPWADALTRRVTGLMEPLRVVEIDDTRDEAILRSEEPTVRGAKRTHYELRLEGGRKATLTRYVAATDPAAKRQPTTFVLTHEVLAKLVDDLTAPLG